jgi:flagellar motor protein MotB
MALIKTIASLAMRKKLNELTDEVSETENLLDIMVPYADLMTLLLVFFVFFYIISDFEKSRLIAQQNEELIALSHLDSLLDMNEKVITIPGEILFDSGKAELKWNSLRTLAQVAENIKRELGENSNKWQIRVEGHTDNVPILTEKYASNWELSTDRALKIVKFFVENNYFPPSQLQAMGFGEFKPIVPNDTDANKKKNRRVEIRLTRRFLEFSSQSQ